MLCRVCVCVCVGGGGGGSEEKKCIPVGLNSASLGDISK